MGGDHAPGAVLRGIQLLRKEVKADLILLGDESVLKSHLKKWKGPLPEIIHCPETIEMSESPVQAVRSKKNSSIVRGLMKVAEEPNSAFFSAGHSGAVMAAAMMALKRIPGVERPAIATALPSEKGHLILIDAGANVECRPSMLVEFAQMGAIYASVYLKKENPSVGLLSNGEEDSKGTELTRQAHELLKAEKNLNYLGYIEGKAMFKGHIDVVVTDGFTGNVVLKSLEGLAKAITTLIKNEFKQSLVTRMGTVLFSPFLAPAFLRLQKKLDHAEVGSAPLLGVDGLCFIGHGSSTPKAIRNGILRAQEALESKLHTTLRDAFVRG